MSETESKRGRLGMEIDAELTRLERSASWLARKLEFSKNYAYQIMSSQRSASPELVDRIATVLSLDPSRTLELHRAACQDLGYRV